jgi:8-oxo-dGTP diphosphatase
MGKIGTDVGNRIRTIREERDRFIPGEYTQAALARRLGVSANTVRSWELDRAQPRKAAAKRLAKVLGVKVEDLGLHLTQPAQLPTGESEGLKPLAAAVIMRHDRVLLTERRFPGHGEVWSWPSGKIEQGESLEDAMLRELHEELLIDNARIVKRLGDIDLPSGFRMTHFYVVIPDDSEPKLNDYEQLSQIRWMTRREAEDAFKTLPADISQRALQFIDQLLSPSKEGQEISEEESHTITT